jgi:hypothetical protein
MKILSQGAPLLDQAASPQNVPQLYANQALHARYAAHARAFLLSDFVSIENKGAVIQIPKLDVAGSSPIARSILS